ncbi:MAG: hypothetical protein B6I20_11625 [Bacteroidetes bacterium 4572_117]|nr:MAG: hypothetical protein B6I20_11625 [Bacteroidetes bacterium 4572_117]
MKSLAIIISVYILALIAIPCADAHASDSGKVSMELLQQDYNHSDGVDLCSPFCFCNCCQTHSQPAGYNTYQVNLVSSTISMAYLYQNEINYTFSFWRPPQS